MPDVHVNWPWEKKEKPDPDPYGRNGIPKGPSFFDFWRPVRCVAWFLLWYCWRACDYVSKCKWDGTRDNEPLSRNREEKDHSTDFIVPWFVTAIMSVPIAGVIGLYLASWPVWWIALICINVAHFVVNFSVFTMFKLGRQEARSYWSERLLR